MAAKLHITHFTDPGCPWAWSAAPALAVLHWRFGDQLDTELVMIGLAEDPQLYVDRGYTPLSMALGYRRFRRFAMPFATAPKPRVAATSPACRVIVAARLRAPDREAEVFRALQLAQFTTTGLLDEPADLIAALEGLDGLDSPGLVAAIEDADVRAAYEEDRTRARSAEGGPTQWQGKSFDSDGAERFTAPSLLFRRLSDGATLEAGGFQSVEAYDVCLANLDTTLTRRPPGEDVVEVLRAFDWPLCTREVAAVCAPSLTDPDDDATEDALIAAAAAGRVHRTTAGSTALWRAA